LRRDAFLRVADDWAGSSAENLNSDSEKVLVHQHIVAHLKANSDRSRAVIDEAFYEVQFSAALFTALALLFPFSLLGVWTSSHPKGDPELEALKSFSTETYVVLITLVWVLGVIGAYSVKRQFREFCNQALTFSLHFHVPFDQETHRLEAPPRQWLGPHAHIAGVENERNRQADSV
jgi:hypothetical protein